MRQVIVASAVRTPIGRFQGKLSSLSATQLGSIIIHEAVRRAEISPVQIDEVIMGNVLSAGLGQAPARQASIGGGLPETVPCTTINKVCGSGLKAVMMAAQAIALGDADIVVAGGMESMTHAPYLLERARSGGRVGHAKLIDSLIKDGLWDVYNDFHMGSAAERCAKDYQLSRTELDDFAILSYKQAQKAQEAGEFKREIVPISLQKKAEHELFSDDEEPGRANFEKIRQLTPAFDAKGTITAGNASPLSDGAAALVLMSKESAEKWEVPVRALISGYSNTATEPSKFTMAPADAINVLLEKMGLRIKDIDLFEINEAFAASSIAVIRKLGIAPNRVNKRGGAVALGHPLGASGARILTTLIHLLEDHGLQRGIASLCIGGGEAVALLVERKAGG
ncbi:thiolase family protein [Nitrospira defluvii]|nr:thiolase family protein [Nitrospira defluvii]